MLIYGETRHLRVSYGKTYITIP